MHNRFLVLSAIIVSGMAGVTLAQEGGRVFIVRTGKPTRQTISQSVRKTGSLVSPAEVAISAKIAGRLLKLELADGTRLEEGVRVKAGDIIYVPKDDLAEYNVFVNKLMPTAQIFNLIAGRANTFGMDRNNKD